jgi:hypothetical protein
MSLVRVVGRCETRTRAQAGLVGLREAPRGTIGYDAGALIV